MRLKRVRLFGFKTFADRTEFDLEGGLVVVAGPNGCGKSNLVDAILWGLGEGSARNLRAGSSQDVIFNGSANRKPVGFAEVTLLFDNEDGSLPVEFPEVAVTRKVNRAGESDYQINRRQCRLRDVHELLADSGLGRSGYAIVGQRQIDQALSAGADERRAWLDEAAGVQRYRARKQESLRRLTSANSHLDRVRDILTEIESQREPLKAEAEVALRYRAVQTSLRELESDLLAMEISRATLEAANAQRAAEDSQRLADKESALAEELDAKTAELSEAIQKHDIEMERAREAKHQATMRVERADGTIRLAEQRLAALADLAQNLDQEREVSSARLLEAKSELAQAETELTEEKTRLEELRKELSGAGTEAQSLRKKLSELDGKLAEERRRESERLKRMAEIAHAETRLKEIARERKGIDASLPGLREGLDEAEAALSAAQATLDDAEKEISNHVQKQAESRKLDAEDEQTRRVLLSQRGALEGRRQGLEMTIEAHEGLAQGPRAVMEAARAGRLPQAYTPVGEAIEAPKDLALAIETALGAAANDLIVPSDREAKEAIAFLKEHRLGRATFQPIPLMRPVQVTNELRDRLRDHGVLGRASEMVDCEPSHRPVIESLLGRVLVVETLDDALRLARTQGWSRLVTLDGETVHSAGSVTGGRQAKAQYGMLQRKADLAEIATEIEGLDKKIQAQEKALRRREVERQEAEVRARSLHVTRTEAESDLKEKRSWRNSVREELISAERQAEKLDKEKSNLSMGLNQDAPTANVAEIEAERDALVAVLAGRNADAENAAASLREAESRLQQADLRKGMAARRVESATEAEKSREKRLQNLGPETEKAKSEIQEATRERDLARQQSEIASTTATTIQTLKEAALAKRTECQTQAKTARQNIAGLLERVHESELARARAESKRASNVERLLDEYSQTEDEALARAGGIQLPADAATVVGRLRRELRGMGEVNLGAVEAYERLTARSDELVAQQVDLEESIRHIQAGVRELDKLTRDRFQTTFEKVSAAFSELFQRLFGGGEGHLVLDDPENLLESGVGLEVTLPGKRRQNLELLSGGERSLCGSAFLFALLKVKPSPLVVLDEVDAPLDGRNVERFIELLRDFSREIQFIVITHHPATIAAASACIGVTMEQGASLLVPFKFPEPPQSAIVELT